MDEVAQHILFNEVVDVVGGSGGHVGEAPGGFELELGNAVMQQDYKYRDQIGVDDSLNWRCVFNGKESSHADTGQQFDSEVLLVNHLLKCREVRDLESDFVDNAGGESLEVQIILLFVIQSFLNREILNVLQLSQGNSSIL